MVCSFSVFGALLEHVRQQETVAEDWVSANEIELRGYLVVIQIVIVTIEGCRGGLDIGDSPHFGPTSSDPHVQPGKIHYDQCMVTRQRVIFQGRVQGVGFRARTRLIAAGFEVTGWGPQRTRWNRHARSPRGRRHARSVPQRCPPKNIRARRKRIHAHVRTEANEHTFEIHRSIPA